MDSFLTLRPFDVERKVKDRLKNDRKLYEGVFEGKPTKDMELILVSSEEEYAELVALIQDTVTQVEQEGENDVRVKLMELELRKVEIEADARKADAEARRAVADADARKADAEARKAVAETQVRLAELGVGMSTDSNLMSKESIATNRVNINTNTDTISDTNANRVNTNTNRVNINTNTDTNINTNTDTNIDTNVITTDANTIDTINSKPVCFPKSAYDAFIRECCSPLPHSKCTVDDMLDSFVSWANGMGIQSSCRITGGRKCIAGYTAVFYDEIMERFTEEWGEVKRFKLNSNKKYQGWYGIQIEIP